jgi:hypothetical protein
LNFDVSSAESEVIHGILQITKMRHGWTKKENGMHIQGYTDLTMASTATVRRSRMRGWQVAAVATDMAASAERIAA